jgi:cyclohexanone monooxygenase
MNGDVNGDERLDAVVLGAGLGGLHMLYKLRSMGLRVLALEAGHTVGGAW